MSPGSGLIKGRHTSHSQVSLSWRFLVPPATPHQPPAFPARTHARRTRERLKERSALRGEEKKKWLSGIGGGRRVSAAAAATALAAAQTARRRATAVTRSRSNNSCLPLRREIRKQAFPPPLATTEASNVLPLVAFRFFNPRPLFFFFALLVRLREPTPVVTHADGAPCIEMISGSFS